MERKVEVRGDKQNLRSVFVDMTHRKNTSTRDQIELSDESMRRYLLPTAVSVHALSPPVVARVGGMKTSKQVLILSADLNICADPWRRLSEFWR